MAMTATPTAPTTTTASRRRSIVLVAGVLLVALLAWTGIQVASATATDERAVQVTDGNGEQHLIPLADDGTYSFDTDLGTNTIVIEDGSVSMHAATCPNQDCIEQGHIHSGGEIILCLPNQLMVTIVGDGEQASGASGVDTVAGS